MESGSKQGGNHLWPAVAAVAAVVGAAGALLGGLAAAGLFDDDASTPPVVTGLPDVATTTTSSPTGDRPEPTTPSRVTATLVYNQGGTGCSPDFDLTIGDRSFSPVGIRFQMNDLLPGVQSYTTTGSVSCLNGAGCFADGAGQIAVAAGQVFEIVWQEIAPGECTLTVS